MLSKNKIKAIRSLELKKNRQATGLFVAEGPKVVHDLLEVMPAKTLLATQDWLNQNHTSVLAEEVIEVSEEELRKVSFLQHPQHVIAVFPKNGIVYDEIPLQDTLSIFLDGVQDPGNLGTIIRIADWFGITNIVCSPDTADVYNPKVVQATMGSIARIHTTYGELTEILSKLPSDFPVYGTLLDGDNIYDNRLTPYGIIVMGNEGKGISPAIRNMVNRRLRIPNFPPERVTADSLNVAVATAIVCSEFRRSMKY